MSSRSWCPDCERYVTPKGGVSVRASLLNLFLLAVSCGLWLPFMILIGVFAGEKRCPRCESRELYERSR